MEMGNLVERIAHLQQQNSESQEAYIEQQARLEALCEELKVGLLRVRVCVCACIAVDIQMTRIQLQGIEGNKYFFVSATVRVSSFGHGPGSEAGFRALFVRD